MKPTAAVEHGRTIGRLRGPGGSAEDAIVDIIEAAAGISSRGLDLTAGEVVIGQTTPLLEIHTLQQDGTRGLAVYGERPPIGAYAVTHHPIDAVCAIAREILNVQ